VPSPSAERTRKPGQMPVPGPHEGKKGARLWAGGRREPCLRARLHRQIPVVPGPSGPDVAVIADKIPHGGRLRLYTSRVVTRVRPTQGIRDDPPVIRGVLMSSLAGLVQPCSPLKPGRREVGDCAASANLVSRRLGERRSPNCPPIDLRRPLLRETLP